MKLQEVILKAMAKRLSWIEAAEIAGMSVRNMQRMRDRYREHGYNGLFDQRRGSAAITGLRWRPRSECWRCTGTSTRTSTCGISTRNWANRRAFSVDRAVEG